MHAASGLLSLSMELLALASRQCAPNIVDVFVRFVRTPYNFILFLVSERSGRWKPPAERSAFDTYLAFQSSHLSHAFLYYLSAIIFHFTFSKSDSSPFFCFFFVVPCTRHFFSVRFLYVPCMSVLSSICCVLQHKHSAAQSARPKAAKQVRADQSATTQARKQKASTVLSTASTAPHIAIRPHKAAKQVHADHGATTQASRQNWREPARVVEHLSSTLSSQNERRHRNLPGLEKYTTAHTALV